MPKLTAPAPKLNPPTPAPKLIGPLRFLLKRPFLSMFTSHSERFIQESNNKYYYSTTLPHQKISVKDKNLIINKAVSYLQEYTKIRPKMTRKLCGPVDDCVGLVDCGDEAVEKVCSLLWTSPGQFKHLDNHFSFQSETIQLVHFNF